MARPRKEINKKQFEGLCAIQCTEEEICQVLDVTDKTLNSWCKREYKASFSEVFRQKRGVGRVSLRRTGFEMAKKNPSVHIFYAKNFLGMTDKTESAIEVKNEEFTEAWKQSIIDGFKGGD